MCNLSEVFIERGLREGLERGMAQGLEKGLEQGLEQGKAQTAIIFVNTLRELQQSNEFIIEKLMKEFEFSEEKAKANI